jgi:hypothetical protein
MRRNSSWRPLATATGFTLLGRPDVATAAFMMTSFSDDRVSLPGRRRVHAVSF